MRILLLAPLAVLVACVAEHTSAPPKTPDRASELRHYDPTDPSIKSNPPPERWMLGCFTVEPVETIEAWPEFVRELELTTEHTRLFGSHQLYRVVGTQTPVPSGSSWAPYEPGKVNVVLGEGSTTWWLKLARAANGLEGTAQWSSDTLQKSPEFRVRLVSHRCGFTRLQPN